MALSAKDSEKAIWIGEDSLTRVLSIGNQVYEYITPQNGAVIGGDGSFCPAKKLSIDEGAVSTLLASCILNKCEQDCDEMATSPSASPVIGLSAKSAMHYLASCTAIDAEGSDVEPQQLDWSGLSFGDRDLVNINFTSIFGTVLKDPGNLHSRVTMQINFDSILKAAHLAVNELFSLDSPNSSKAGTLEYSPTTSVSTNGSVRKCNGESDESTSIHVPNEMVQNFKLLVAKRELLLETSRYLKLICQEKSTEHQRNANNPNTAEVLVRLEQLTEQIIEYKKILLSVANERFLVYQESITNGIST